MASSRAACEEAVSVFEEESKAVKSAKMGSADPDVADPLRAATDPADNAMIRDFQNLVIS